MKGDKIVFNLDVNKSSEAEDWDGYSVEVIKNRVWWNLW